MCDLLRSSQLLKLRLHQSDGYPISENGLTSENFEDQLEKFIETAPALMKAKLQAVRNTLNHRGQMNLTTKRVLEDILYGRGSPRRSPTPAHKGTRTGTKAKSTTTKSAGSPALAHDLFGSSPALPSSHVRGVKYADQGPKSDLKPLPRKNNQSVKTSPGDVRKILTQVYGAFDAAGFDEDTFPKPWTKKTRKEEVEKFTTALVSYGFVYKLPQGQKKWRIPEGWPSPGMNCGRNLDRSSVYKYLKALMNVVEPHPKDLDTGCRVFNDDEVIQNEWEAVIWT